MSDAPSSQATPKESTELPAQGAKSKVEPYLTQEYGQHVEELIAGKAPPKKGTEELIDDLKGCLQKQNDARAALQQTSQFLQAKQSEFSQLQGEATALLRLLYRGEQAAARKT